MHFELCNCKIPSSFKVLPLQPRVEREDYPQPIVDHKVAREDWARWVLFELNGLYWRGLQV